MQADPLGTHDRGAFLGWFLLIRIPREYPATPPNGFCAHCQNGWTPGSFPLGPMNLRSGVWILAARTFACRAGGSHPRAARR